MSNSTTTNWREAFASFTHVEPTSGHMYVRFDPSATPNRAKGSWWDPRKGAFVHTTLVLRDEGVLRACEGMLGRFMEPPRGGYYCFLRLGILPAGEEADLEVRFIRFLHRLDPEGFPIEVDMSDQDQILEGD